MNTYQIESSPRFAFAIKTGGTLADPTTVKVSIEEPDGIVVVDKVAATDDAGTGAYSYNHTLGTKTGIYKLSLEMVGATSLVSIETSTFRVVGRFAE